MKPKIIKFITWILTGIIGILFIITAAIKFSGSDMAAEMTQGLGVNTTTLILIGIVELISVTLFMIPRTGIPGTLLLVAYMGGAMVAHIINGESFIFPAVIQVLIWITAYLRFPELHHRIYNRPDVNIQTN